MSTPLVRVLILMARTGGGHLSAAQAIAQALHHRYPNAVQVTLVDVLADHAPFPLNRLENVYPLWVGPGVQIWRWCYRLTDGPWRAAAILRLFWPMVWPAVRCLLHTYPADVIVSVHPLTNHPLLWALRRLKRSTPLVTVVTDPVSVHPFWLSPGVARCLVGSPQAQRRALACGLPPECVKVTGLPIDHRFLSALTDANTARQQLGWPLDERPIVLLVGGGEGMGQLEAIAQAIDRSGPNAHLVIVAGRNQRLRQRLEAHAWRLPTCIYGFVENMPRLMSAADLLITKAGPGTLHEAFAAGLPLILSSAIPGQESGNVRLVVENGAGVWASKPEQIAALLNQWLGAGDDTLTRMAACSRALARPQAADEIAQEIGALAPIFKT